MQFKLLIAERSSHRANQIKKASEKEDIAFVRVSNPAQVYRAAMEAYPDAILLIEEPGVKTSQVKGLIEKLNTTPRVAFIPIFCLCKKEGHEHKETALKFQMDCLGAGLSVSKVLSFIKGRIDLYRRNSALKLGSIALEPVRRLLWSNHGTKISRKVPPKEFELLYHLGMHGGQPVPENTLRKVLQLKPDEKINHIASRARKEAPLPVRRLLHIDFVPDQGWRLTID